MDLKRLLSAKNVVVGGIVTAAAILSSIQTIRDNVSKLFPHQQDAGIVQWETVDDNRITGQLLLNFHWKGMRDADAPAVKSSRIEGARRVTGDSTLFEVGQRIGKDKWPVTLQREKSGGYWQPVAITIQTDRAGTTQIYVPQEEVSSGQIARSGEVTRRIPPQSSSTPPVTSAPPGQSQPPPTQPQPPPRTTPRDTTINSAQSAIEQAALRELRRILNTDSPPQKIIDLQRFIRDPQFAGTAAQQQAKQELQKLMGG